MEHDLHQASHPRRLGELSQPASPARDAVHLRAEAFAQTPDEARAIADKVNVFVALTHTAETSVGSHGTDADVKAFFDSLKVKQEDDRAVLTAAVPYGFLRKMMSDPAPDLNEPPDSLTNPGARQNQARTKIRGCPRATTHCSRHQISLVKRISGYN